MISSWLRRLFDNRYKAASRSTRGKFRRLEVERLETRIAPTVCTWTGNAVPDTGEVSVPGDPRWSNPGNWKNGVVPRNFDDVVFPTGVPPVNTIGKVGNRESPPDGFE